MAIVVGIGLLFGCRQAEPPESSDPSPTTLAFLATEDAARPTVTPIFTPTESTTQTAPPQKVGTPTPPVAPATAVLQNDESGYLPPDPTPTEAIPYPLVTRPVVETPTGAPAEGQEGEGPFLPIVSNGPSIPTETPTPTFTPTATPTPTPTPIPTLDFGAVRSELNNRGVDLQVSKIGFHIGPGGNRDGLGTYIRRLDEAGVPIFLKSVGDAGPLYDAQLLMEESGVPHVLVYRFAGDAYDTPNYDLPPAESARQHWALHMERWPPELDPEVVWLETLNEVDKNRSEWLAEFALETAALAERDGFKWAAFGWSSGEPEIEHWAGPQMIRFLQLAAERPDRLAIALHEYSFLTDTITHLYPYKVGRFQLFFDFLDKQGIARPTVLITEWGWAYQDVPPPDLALEHIEWANRLYAPYPEIKGGAIWYLGPGFGGVADQTQKLIEPVMIYSLTTYFERPLPPTKAPIDPNRYGP